MVIDLVKKIFVLTCIFSTTIFLEICVFSEKVNTMSPVVRKAVRVLLLNESDQLLLMCIEDFDIKTVSGEKNKRFWCTVGGGIEAGEFIEQAALREIYEETGIAQDCVELGPVVWHSMVELMLKGTLTCLDESFIVARTKQNEVGLHQATEDEKQVVKSLQWFSLLDIQKSSEVIFPIALPKYLPDVIAQRYPDQPFKITE